MRVGICGLGTVGSGVFNLLKKNRHEISRRLGREIRVQQVGCRSDNPACDLSDVEVSRDIFDVVKNPNVDIVVELIGGIEPAKKLVLQAIGNGKHVVTANKALIAIHGNEIFEAAASAGVEVRFEASIGGGIPIVKAIREGLAANRIDWVAGIINGTCNYILTEMETARRDFADVLIDAQRLGYAEADPTFDIEGIDAAHKLTILSSIAFGTPLDFDAVYMEGISNITQQDIRFAAELGFTIKHLGIARQSDAGIELRVHPALVAKTELLANVHGVMNAIMIGSNSAGPTMYYGAGAGADATASAVSADIIDTARGLFSGNMLSVPALGFQVDQIDHRPVIAIDDIKSCYYLNMMVVDQPGVLANISSVLSQHQISIEALIQKEAKDYVPIVILTDAVTERNMNTAIAEIESKPEVQAPLTRIRVESLG